MENLEDVCKPAGQVLKDFDEMMELIKPYLPPKMIIREPKPAPYQPTETIPYTEKRKF